MYDIKDGYIITKNYLQKSKSTVTKQLLQGGLRLAAVLEKIFYATSPVIDFAEITKSKKNSIDIKEVANNIGKQVTICEHVYSVRETPAITQISVGGKYPNSPLTIIVFPGSYGNFSKTLTELYAGKNICVQGKIEEYKGKPQIIVEKPDNIEVIEQ